MHILDIILGVFLLLLALWGIKKGFVATIIQLVGLIMAFLIISKMGHFVKDWLIIQFELPELIAVIASYILIFIVIMLLIRLIIFFMHRFVELLHLKWLNRLLGGLLSIINGLLVISILTIILNISPFKEEIDKATKESRIMGVVHYITGIVEPQLVKYTDPLKDKIDQTINEGKEEIMDQAQEKILDKTKK